ncbi:unnamed protein product, partial [Meganyctiphanes norvegica]
SEFVLSEAGDVTWSVTEGCDILPLFACQMYEVYTYQNLQCYGNRTLLRFAAYKGHIIEFRLDQPVMSRDLMLLTYDGWFMLQCEKLHTPDTQVDLTYSLLPALQDGYFSDLTLTAATGRIFEVHRVVLECSAPWVDWSLSPSPLHGLEEPVLETLIHYLYCCSLPPTLTTTTAQYAIQATQHLQDFKDFRNSCDIFIKNTNLRNKLVGLMSEVQDCLNTMVELFSPSDLQASSQHLISMLKQALRHCAIGLVKLVEVCAELEVWWGKLTTEEQQEVMRVTRAQLPPMLQATVRLAANLRAHLHPLSHHSRQDLANHLVPQISLVLSTVCEDVGSLRSSLEHIIQASTTSLESSHSPTHLLAKSLSNDLHLRELQKLRILQENLTSFLNSLVHKREQFSEMGTGARVRGVARIIEHFTEELPVLTLRLEEAAAALDDMLEWSEFKFVFKGATSKVASIVERLVEHRSLVEALVMDLVERVGHPAFTASLTNLGLFPHNPDSHSSGNKMRNTAFEQNNKPSSDVLEQELLNEETVQVEQDCSIPLGEASVRQDFSVPLESIDTTKLSVDAQQMNLVGRVCEPPKSRMNPLAVNISKLLHTGHHSDMTFVVVPPQDDETSLSSSVEDLDTVEGDGGSEVKDKDNHLYDHESCLSVTPPTGPRVSPTVVRKVKKSLSLDHRPSCRPTVPSHAYSLDCDASLIPTYGGPASMHVNDSNPNDFLNKTEAAAAHNSDSNIHCDSHKSCFNHSVSDDKINGLFQTFRQSLSINTDILGDNKLCDNIENSEIHNKLSINVRNTNCFIQNQRKSNDKENKSRETIKRQLRISESDERLKSIGLNPIIIDNESKEHSGIMDNKEQDITMNQESCDKVKNSEEEKQISYKNKQQNKCSSVDERTRLFIDSDKNELSESLLLKTHRKESMELRAHRVVVAARCEWFRRALLSGMREAIDRCIVVHGCSVETFTMLLRFLYSGHVDCPDLQPDMMVDLLVLADHYGVDALKLQVEMGLEQHVDDDSVVPLLTVAHHCNANHLKEVCVRHCVLSTTAIEGETLTQLPADLRCHLTLAMSKHRKWCGDELLVGIGGGRISGSGTGDDSPLSATSTDPLIDQHFIPGLEDCFAVGGMESEFVETVYEGGINESGRNSSSSSSNSEAVETVVQQLREVLGDHVPRSTLLQITLAADYDLNRALNFFFANSNQ